MYQTNLNQRSLRSALLLGAASAAAIGISVPASAQEQVETVVVTGSRIPQTGVYSSSPVTAVGQQELKLEGTTDVTTLINNLPEAFVDQNSAVSNGASGTSNVDLRGLGSKRTLVLVDGTRLMPGDPLDPVADLNDIPAALVDHVEVLTGGASAVYGSDALAGVVNFIMRKDFEGIEVDGTYTVTQNDNDNGTYRGLTASNIAAGGYGFAESKEDIWNGQTGDATLIMGTNTANDKGNITAYMEYRHTAPIVESTRDFSECTIAGTNSGPECSGSSNYDRILSLDGAYHGQSPYDFFEEPDTGTPGGGHFVPYTGAGNQHFNYGALNYLQRPDDRYSAGFFAHYEVNKELDVYSDFMFTDDHTVAQIAQGGLFLASGSGPSGAVYINCGNPLMTAQENLKLCGSVAGDALTTVGTHTFWNGAGNVGVPGEEAGQAEVWVGRRDIEGGDRQSDIRHTAYRLKIGAKGDLGDGWTYDVYAQYGATLLISNNLGNFSIAKVQNALQVNPATGNCISGTGCVPLDIFNGLGSITPSMLNYVSAVGLENGYTLEQVVSGDVTGDLGEWGIQSPWAKSPVQVSLGSEYRSETLKLQPDQELSTGDLYGNGAPTPNVPESSFDVVEGFTEVRAELVQNQPFIEDLSFNGGYRYSSYSTAGATSTYKYGLEWQPIDDIRFRASANRAVRAPNVLELFLPDIVGLFSGQDPCAAGASAAVLANCVHEGVHNAGSALLSCPASQCDAQSGGNINLKPEVSDTRSVGVVLTPTFLDGFTTTIDWFDIDVKDFISSIPEATILGNCYGADATPAGQAYFCPLVHRNQAGTIYGTGGFVIDQTRNTGYLKTSGIDVETNYQTDLSTVGMKDSGSIAFNLIGTWLDTLTTEPAPLGLGTLDQAYGCAGYYGETCGTPNPRWRHKLRVTWSTPWDVDFSVAWRYVETVRLDADSDNENIGGGPGGGVNDLFDKTIPSFNYFDVSGSWTVREGVEFRAGVNNIFDKEPPVIGTQALPLPIGNGNTFPGVYDALGRYIFVGATIKY